MAVLAEELRIFRKKVQQVDKVELRLEREWHTSCIARQCLARLCVDQGQGPGYED